MSCSAEIVYSSAGAPFAKQLLYHPKSQCKTGSHAARLTIPIRKPNWVQSLGDIHQIFETKRRHILINLFNRREFTRQPL